MNTYILVFYTEYVVHVRSVYAVHELYTLVFFFVDWANAMYIFIFDILHLLSTGNYASTGNIIVNPKGNFTPIRLYNKDTF